MHIPAEVLAAGAFSRIALIRAKGLEWFEAVFLPKFRPVTIAALLGMLVLIFAFQAEDIQTHRPVALLLAVPIVVQVTSTPA